MLFSLSESKLSLNMAAIIIPTYNNFHEAPTACWLRGSASYFHPKWLISYQGLIIGKTCCVIPLFFCMDVGPGLTAIGGTRPNWPGPSTSLELEVSLRRKVRQQMYIGQDIVEKDEHIQSESQPLIITLSDLQLHRIYEHLQFPLSPPTGQKRPHCASPRIRTDGFKWRIWKASRRQREIEIFGPGV